MTTLVNISNYVKYRVNVMQNGNYVKQQNNTWDYVCFSQKPDSLLFHIVYTVLENNAGRKNE